MDLCPYCDELKNGFPYGDRKNRIVYRSKNFYVFPALGQLVEGYLLIASRHHFISLGGIPTAYYAELQEVRQKVRNALRLVYGPAIFFEHGAVNTNLRGGCCIDHAHLHAVPTKLDLLDDLTSAFRSRPINSWEDLARSFRQQHSYLYYENQSAQQYLFDAPDNMPAQYIRKLLAKKLGRPNQWNWMTDPTLDKVAKTTDLLSNVWE